MTSATPPYTRESGSKLKPPWWVRLVFVVAGLAAWFWTQSFIGQRPTRGGVIGDGLHQVTETVSGFLHEHPHWANAILILGSGIIDLLGVFLLIWSVIGPSIRPFLGLLILFGLRQICQVICALPPPEGMIWHHPGFPSILVTYEVSNDLFFSGHTAIAVYGAIELARLGRSWLVVPAIVIVLYEVISIILLRAHYTMDVFTGIIAALYVSGIAKQLAPPCDRVLTGIFRRKKREIRNPEPSPSQL